MIPSDFRLPLLPQTKASIRSVRRSDKRLSERVTDRHKYDSVPRFATTTGALRGGQRRLSESAQNRNQASRRTGPGVQGSRSPDKT
ncbi:unnamed protein product [Protopolystoma xenopodis]|uniref:Uncharacterized protein n=1 Tax=Protopolystoma xenopodis TaxID=117903 RepID=A0A3S5AZH9_9PLAT|nr:unnamed protein product [Protopolystoma xenopodis]